MNEVTKALIGGALNIPPNTVTAQTGLAKTSQWDSLAHFRLVLAIEEHLNCRLNPLEIVGLVDAGAVDGLIGTPIS